jgi:hypothetical protein
VSVPGRWSDAEFTDFFQGQYGLLIAFLIKAGFPRVVAEDAASVTMTLAYRRWDFLLSPRAWVRTVAYRIAASEVDRDRRYISHLAATHRVTVSRDGTESYTAVEDRSVKAGMGDYFEVWLNKVNQELVRDIHADLDLGLALIRVLHRDEESASRLLAESQPDEEDSQSGGVA